MKLLDLLFGKREMNIPTSDSVENISKINSFSGNFQMEVEDVFSITGRGTVVTGRVASGTISVGEQVTLSGSGKVTVVTGIEMFRKMLDTASVGDNVGLLLKDVNRDEVSRGEMIYK